ncbi:hypothetical protein [Streptomyces violascens]|uniref:Uncharacterized protein n=1 Tax=Streptomyces violascens TaxID=67381 RepID=A0ABQ3QG04_9ACTN|nr:hypothetical protein [Streptomyces violascens]GGT88259.1 hypothetical protein GCM10010289_05320 [Streptomyces violascens]GHI36198.1 hypothetical protein Sviol_06060 [Streptomyces violascens]
MVRDGDAFTKTGGQDPEPVTAASPALTAVQPAAGEESAAAPSTGTAVQPTQAPDEVKERPAVPWRELPWLTLLLAVGIVAALAFIAGVLVEQHHLQ